MLKGFTMLETFENRFHRSEILFGSAALEKLQSSHVLLAGAGGVGSYIAEALARAGIGKLTVFDPDTVHYTNLNRQLPALNSTIGKSKTAVIESRLQDINPKLELYVYNESLTAENIPVLLENTHFDYIADAIDSVNDKCLLLATAFQKNIPVISAMGAGCRKDPSLVQYADIGKTFNCKLAKTVRTRLKKEYGIIKGIECVFSPESNPDALLTLPDESRPLIGSSSFMPGIFGLFMAGKIINDLSK